MQVPQANTAAAAHSLSVSASAPSGASKRLAVQLEDELELTERDLWEDDADVPEAIQASTSAPTLGLDTSSESEQDLELPSPDIKAFHGDTPSDQHPKPGSPPAEDTAAEATDTFAESTSARRSTDSARLSTDSASARPIVGSAARHRNRRPPLRANSTFANRDGVQRRASIKMVCIQTVPVLEHQVFAIVLCPDSIFFTWHCWHVPLYVDTQTCLQILPYNLEKGIFA